MQPCPSVDHNTTLWHSETFIAENIQIASQTFKLTFNAPLLANNFVPGQFVMIRLAGTNDPLLGRPLAIYRGDTVTGNIEVVYLVVGHMTKKLSLLDRGTPLAVWGPLGKGFELPTAKHLLLVAGGIGQTPFLELVKQEKRYKKITLLFGAKNSSRICCMDDFRSIGVDVQISTDDGSEGYQGFVTELIPKVIEKKEDRSVVLVGCGPRSMLKAVYEAAKALGNLPCYVSLESPMACGLGICFSCVVEHQLENGTYDYLRTCVDGPVFDASKLRWS